MLKLTLRNYRASTAHRTKLELFRLAKIAGTAPECVRFSFNPNGWFLSEIPVGKNTRTLFTIQRAFDKRTPHLFATTDHNDPIILEAIDDMTKKGFRSVPKLADSSSSDKTLWVVGAIHHSTLSRLERVAYDSTVWLCEKYLKRDITCNIYRGSNIKPNDEIKRLLSLLDRNFLGEKAYNRVKGQKNMADRISTCTAIIHRHNLLKRNSGKKGEILSVD
jgi:hypothetical protein